MEYILTVYSFIITILLVAVWVQNKNTFKDLLKEQEHSQDLRKTILKYLKNK